jgi:hypothetical protein
MPDQSLIQSLGGEAMVKSPGDFASRMAAETESKIRLCGRPE